MAQIKVRVLGQNLALLNSPVLASGAGAVNTVRAEFSADWDGYTIHAIFQRGTDAPMRMPVADGEATIPPDVAVTGGEFTFGFFGTVDGVASPLVSTFVRYMVRESIAESVGGTPAPAADVWQLLVSEIAAKVAANQGAANAGKVLGIGADGSVSPVTASGADSAEISSAIEAALAEAKSSGEFDGAPGAPGEPGSPGAPGTTPHIGENRHWYIGNMDSGVSAQGEPGEPGEPGSPGANGTTPVRGTDYWTSDDQTAIVNAVLASLPEAEGGSF